MYYTYRVKLRHFAKFADMTDALAGTLQGQTACIIDHCNRLVLTILAATSAVEGKMSKGLKKVLKKVFVSDMQEQLAVADAKLGSAIKVDPFLRYLYVQNYLPFSHHRRS